MINNIGYSLLLGQDSRIIIVDVPIGYSERIDKSIYLNKTILTNDSVQHTNISNRKKNKKKWCKTEYLEAQTNFELIAHINMKNSHIMNIIVHNWSVKR